MRLTATLAIFAVTLLIVGCSAVVFGAGVDEREMLREGVTRSDLIRRLGRPVSARALPIREAASKLQQEDSDVVVLAPPTYVFDAEMGHKRIPPAAEAMSVATFDFHGRLGNNHYAAESVSLNLMTLGLAEIFLLPAAVKERASQPLQLNVWFDRNDKAVAYKWSWESGKGHTK